jgi:hypothetical protein
MICWARLHGAADKPAQSVAQYRDGFALGRERAAMRDAINA